MRFGIASNGLPFLVLRLREYRLQHLSVIARLVLIAETIVEADLN